MIRHKRVVFRKKKLFGKMRELFADIYFPKDYKNKKGLDRKILILFHGLGSDRKAILNIIDRKMLKDFIIFIPELRPITRPDGTKKIIKEAVDEAEYYIKKAKQYGDNIYLIGHSLGSYLILYTFAKKRVEQDIKGICLLSTPYSLKDVMFRLSINLVEFLGERLDKVGHIIKKIQKQIPGLKYSTRKKMVYFHRFKFSTIRDVKELYDAPNMLNFRAPPMPCILIHGIEDKLVNFSHSAMLFQKFKEKRKDTELILIPHTGHDFKKHKKDITRKIKYWLQNLIDIEREGDFQKEIKKKYG